MHVKINIINSQTLYSNSRNFDCINEKHEKHDKPDFLKYKTSDLTVTGFLKIKHI